MAPALRMAPDGYAPFALHVCSWITKHPDAGPETRMGAGLVAARFCGPASETAEGWVHVYEELWADAYRLASRSDTPVVRASAEHIERALLLLVASDDARNSSDPMAAALAEKAAVDDVLACLSMK